MNLFLLAVLAVVLFADNVSSLQKVRPIRVALAVDDHSFKDLVLLMNSVIESAIEPNNLVFHVVACGKDLMTGNVLKNSVIQSIDSCFPNITKEVIAFALPSDSGFRAQLERAKSHSKKISHWNSQIGADMVRFYLASLFPHAERLLYLDNDIIVSCCIEEVFDTDMGTDKVIGLALDDLNWATVTQFRNHYNASHPLVIKNVRRNQSAINQYIHNQEPISKEEFSKALPRYPNDGVMLIHVQRYNDYKILSSLEEIANANALGEYVVNLGTQQFTVLAMFDRWVELTPRANLRHFPDMARGYLMWFYYNGFIHYAGQAKPRQLCAYGTSRDNWLRVQSYTAWAHSNAQVARKCGHDKLVYVDTCIPHIPAVTTMVDFTTLLRRIAAISKDETLEYIRVGPLHGDLSATVHSGDHAEMVRRNNSFGFPRGTVTDADTDTTASSTASAGTASEKSLYFIEIIDRLALHNASWSFRNYDCRDTAACESLLSTAVDSIHVDPKTAANAQAELARAAGNNKKRGIATSTTAVVPANQARFGGKRTFLVYDKFLCTSLPPADRPTDPVQISTAPADGATVAVSGKPCTSLIEDVRREGKKHWDVLGIVIDTQPPVATSTATSSGNSNDKNSAGSAPYNSLSVLLGLDLVFMRPKFVVLWLASGTAEGLETDTQVAIRFLSRNGFVVQREREGYCDTSSNSRRGKDSKDSENRMFYSCLWGTRLNVFELTD